MASNYRIAPRAERRLAAEVRDLSARLEALCADSSAAREIAHYKDEVAARDDAIAKLTSKLAQTDERHSRDRAKVSEAIERRRAWEASAKDARHKLKDALKSLEAARARIEGMRESQKLLARQARELEGQIEELKSEIARKDELISHLNARLSRGPGNSSCPPSSSPNTKRIPNSRARTGRKPGAQPHHKGHPRKQPKVDERVYVSEGEVGCPECGGAMTLTGREREHTLTDITIKTHTVAHVSRERRCPRCGQTHWDAFPKDCANEANYGPTIKAAIAYLVGACNVSGANARGFLRAITAGKVDVSGGSVSNFMRQFSSLAKEDLGTAFDAVATSDVIGSDATFTRSEGHQSYVFVFHGGDAAAFRATDTKGHAALKGSPVDLAPDATIVHDHDTTYYSYGKRHAECNVHVLRYLRGVRENEADGAWAEEMTSLLKGANRLAKKARDGHRGEVDPKEVGRIERRYREILEGALEGYAAQGATCSQYPPDGLRLARRMLRCMREHLLFLHDLSVPFENNRSERLLRQAKKKVKQSGGFRSTANGEQPYCDFLTIVETAKMRGIPAFEAVHATFAGQGNLFS